MSDHNQLLDALNAFLQVSNTEEIADAFLEYPELFENEIDSIFTAAIENTREQGEVEKVQFLEKRHQLLQIIRPKLKESNNDNDIAVWYWRRYSAKGNLNDLTTAISALEATVAKTPTNSPKLPGYLNNLGVGLIDRYKRLGDLKDLQAGIEICQQAVTKTPPTSPDLPILLNSLGVGLIDRYAHLGDLKDLQASIVVSQQSVVKTPPDSPKLPGHISNLGRGLTSRYTHLGDLKDLQAGIKAYQRAVQLTPVDSPDLPMFLNGLGGGLRTCYTSTGDLSDLQAGIKAFQQVVQLTPEGSPKLPAHLNNLGIGLIDRYDRKGDWPDLQAAIEAFQRAVQLTPEGSTELPTILNSLGSSGLGTRYARTGDLTDLQMRIVALQRAVQLTPAGAPHFPSHLNSLGAGFRDRYERTGDLSDLQTCIEAFQRAVQLTPADSPELPAYLNNHGLGWRDHYARTGDLTDLQAGIAAFQQAAQRGLKVALEVSLTSARNWLHWVFTRQAWQEVTDAYSYAYKAGQRLLKSQLLRAHKESWLKDMQGLASQAAYAFTQLNQPKEAVVTLERGLARLLSEALQRDRANLEQLKTTGHTDLYDRYQEIVGRYHWAQQQQNIDVLKTTQADLDKTIEDIRQVPDYENFLMPPEFDLIQAAAQETPLVYILTTSAGGLALIVHQQTVTSVELPEFTEEALTQKKISYFTAYDNQQQNRQAWHQAIDDMGQWLWQVLWQPLREKLPNQQRITLIPVGWLNLLPLHAAWTADTTQPTDRRYALDELTIAYAPNAVSLQKARDLATHIQSDKLLAIDEPKPVKANPLPSSSVEVHAIARHFTQPQLLRHHAATQETVKKTLNLNYNVLHFSCHGGANFENPLETGLVMANDQMLTVQHFLDAKLQARLATLSACETGMIGTKNIEEVVGLPASLLQAGVAGVVASLWSVNELSTALLMIKFYECFFQNPSDTAVALRTAQRWLRDATQAKLVAQVQQWGGAGEIQSYLENWYNPDEQPYTHPYYWSAFCAVGQ